MLTCHIKPAKHHSVSVAIVIMLELLMLAFGMCISISSRSCMTIDSSKLGRVCFSHQSVASACTDSLYLDAVSRSKCKTDILKINRSESP